MKRRIGVDMVLQYIGQVGNDAGLDRRLEIKEEKRKESIRKR